MSKKWDSKPALDEHGKPLLNANGKTVLRKSYSVLQDDFFAAMRKAGYDDVERGERGSSEEHLTVTQFKVQQEQARLAEFTEQNRQQEKQAATLGSKIEKIQNQRVDVQSIEKIVATSIPFSSKVAVEREDFDRLSTLAKKYVTAEKKRSRGTKLADSCVEPEKTHFIEWERVGQGRHRLARSCLKIAIFPKSRAEENT